ncbi:sigma-54 dependent transcriptional regulator [Roseisolibacter sp. H3M3-2]|uniref:sigma-54-dependent transcriptional regulator n=1 Tax=Roseisolibacter sp. H3M3-2 TaxID=3031323 RepID=UPI0023DB1ED6|nr:sigma-54 dependent transcriptional regulator [Roseisolibacter sp. H3M3-2]MDF1503539.1 sigma-54 dependent transcriptional regulator [Roseisolibacter sp. H3M3-2]
MALVLLIDDDEAIRFGVGTYLRARGYAVEEADGVVAGELAFRTTRPHAVVCDYELPDGTALDLLPRLRRIDEQVPVVLLTGHGSVDLAVQAIKEGAEHFLTKPVALPALEVVLERAVENRRARQRQLAQRVSGRAGARRDPDPFVGVSPAIRALEEQAHRVLGTDRPVWLRGETGAGKGVLARWLHARGPRADEALVELNCAGLPRELVESELFGHEKGAFTGAAQAKPGLLEVAHRGTLFLDEIGDMPLDLQPKLLKALEDRQVRRLGEVRDRPVDLQLIAATHQDLGERSRLGTFRSDLYFRISTLKLDLPPLRERPEDVPLLARDLLARVAADLALPPAELAPDALEALRRYAWPGNVRELRNVLERAVLLGREGGVIGRADLAFERGERTQSPAAGAAGDWDDLTLEQVEARHIGRVLQLEQGHVERAAQRLGISRSSLYAKIKLYGLQPKG